MNEELRDEVAGVLARHGAATPHRLADHLAPLLARLTQERDRARDVACALEGEVARVSALAAEWEDAASRRAPQWVMRQVSAVALQRVLGERP